MVILFFFCKSFFESESKFIADFKVKKSFFISLFSVIGRIG